MDEHLVWKVGWKAAALAPLASSAQPSNSRPLLGSRCSVHHLRKSCSRTSLYTPEHERCLTASQLSAGLVRLCGWLQGLLQRAPEDLAPGEDFSQMLCFSEETLQEAKAAARRRTGSRKAGRQGAGSAAAGGAGGLPGAALGVEGVREGCLQQQAVVLVNNGQFVAFPPDRGTAAGPAAARPVTAVVAA